MIIRERKDSLLLITQPDHAAIAGEFADHYKVTLFRGYDWLEEVLWAIREHDSCWKEADEQPLLNIRTGRPYSFDDYPADRKTALYTAGIDGMQPVYPYAALLCSLHFAYFFEKDSSPEGAAFRKAETQRQQQLIRELGLGEQERECLRFHLRLLQFCDNLSLFICLNEGGKNEHPWFREGLPGTEELNPRGETTEIRWGNSRTILLEPCPFIRPVELELGYRSIPAYLSDQEALWQAWEGSPRKTLKIKIR